MGARYLLLTLAISVVASSGCDRQRQNSVDKSPDSVPLEIAAAIPPPTEITAADTVQLESVISLYYNLNIRSFNSSLGPRLKADCGRHLADFFPEPVEGSYTSEQMRLQNGDDSWTIKLHDAEKSPNYIEVTNRILGSSYHSTSSFYVSYDVNSHEWRKTGDLIELPGNCFNQGSSTDITLSNKQNLVFSNRHLSAQAWHMDSQSVGEFDLSPLALRVTERPCVSGIVQGKPPADIDCAINPVRLYAAPMGNSIGHMYMHVQPNAIGNADAEVWFIGSKGEVLAEPHVVMRANTWPRLLVFEYTSNGWARLSANSTAGVRRSDTGIWIKTIDTVTPLVNLYKPRTDVLAAADVIEILAPHRLRTGPDTQSDILTVLQADDSLMPLEVNGDWVKVKPLLSEMIDNQATLTRFTEAGTDSGWLKWREKPGREYVSFEHW